MPTVRLKILARRVFSFYQSPFFCFILIGVGVFIRLKFYLQNCSFWVDESYLALQIVHQSWPELLNGIPLIPELPSHPPGFVFLEKLLVGLWGNHEYALRFIPLLAGILSLFLFYRFLRLYVALPAVPLALGLFSFSWPMVYYSAQLRPYTLGVAVVLSLLISGRFLDMKRLDLRQAVLWGLGGGAALLLVYPAVFVLSGIAAIMVFAFWKERQLAKARTLLVILGIWFLFLAYLYYLSLGQMMGNKALFAVSIKSGTLRPEPLWSMPAMAWIKNAVVGLFQAPGGFSLPYPALLIFIPGCYYIYSLRKNDAALLLIPGLLCLLAATLNLYPLYDKTWLFFVPMLFAFFSAGCVFIISRLPNKYRIIGVIIVCLSVSDFARVTGAQLFSSRCREEDNRTVMQLLARHYQKGDFIYLNNDAMYSFCYYASQTRLTDRLSVDESIHWRNETLQGTKMARFTGWPRPERTEKVLGLQYFYFTFNAGGLHRRLISDSRFSRMHGVYAGTTFDFVNQPRAWVYMSRASRAEKDFILNFFDRHGQRLEAWEARGAALYLYNLN